MARPQPHKRAVRATAVSIVTFLAVLVAIWLAPRVSDAVAAWVRTPPVRSATIVLSAAVPVQRPSAAATGSASGLAASPSSAAATRSAAQAHDASGGPAVAGSRSAPVVDAGLHFTMIGVTCRPPAKQGPVTVRMRTSEDGAAWSGWYEAALDSTSDADGGARLAFTEPVWTGGGRFVQVSAYAAASALTSPIDLHGVHVVAINSTEDADGGAVVLGVLRRTIATVAGVDLTPAAGAMTTRPVIVTRSQWGANEAYRSGSPDFATVRMAFVHHTDSGNSYSRSQAPAIVRGVYYYHTKSLHWSDIGYNFLVDRYGTVYEGRYGGVTKGAIGAQTLGFNTGSTGISVIGTFSKVAPPQAAVSALEKLLAWKLDVHHIDPLGSATLTCGYGQKFATGQKVKFHVIAGHRDANYTDCPGNKLYGLLPSIRKAVAAIGRPKLYGFSMSPGAISPNGDGVLDQTTIGFIASETVKWHIEISQPGGDVLRRISGQGATAKVTWGGRDDQGHLLPDGDYALAVGASSARGAARPVRTTIRIDTTPPQLQSATVGPDPFSPNGDGHGDKTFLRFQPGERGSARVSVVSGSQVLRRVTGWRAVSARSQAVAWDGRINVGGKLAAAPEGHATLEVAMRDVAGNEASVRRTVVVDRTLGFLSVKPRVCSPNGDGTRDTVAVGFTLTRRADISVTIVKAGQVVRTLRPGAMAAGTRTVTWDGLISGGEYPGSGAYAARVTADSSIGVVAAGETFTVDRYAPRLSVPATASVASGKSAKIAYSVTDPYSATVLVEVTVTDSEAKVVASVSCGWVRRGKSLTFAWKPPAKGTYSLAFGAVDRGGNRQSAVKRTTLKVH
jgi:flagellar hook assembly protein FlgD